MNTQIGIIGPEEKNMKKNKNRMLTMAKEIGKLVAVNKAVLITGGCSGVAQAACKGAQEQKGITVGTPGRTRGTSIFPVTVEICTPIDIGDYLFAGILSSDCIIVFPGDAGTLAELAIAYRYKKPLVFIKGFGEDLPKKLFGSFENKYPLFVVNDAEEAVNTALSVAKSYLNNKTGGEQQ